MASVSFQSALRPLFFSACAALLLGASGCGGGGDGPASLDITSPENGQDITSDDDTSQTEEGIQLTVDVEASGLKDDEEVSLFFDATLLIDDDPDNDPDAVATGTPTDGMVSFQGVTLPSGDVISMIATARDGNVTSSVVTITVSSGCPTVTFVSPDPNDVSAGRLVYGPEDDLDGTECGATFTTEIVAAVTGGTEATLIINGSSRGTEPVEGGLVRFEDIVLDNRGTDDGDENVVAIQVTPEEGDTCAAVLFDGDVFVDCDGVSCSITQPAASGGFLNSADDVSPATDGFQMDFVVESDDEAVGEPVLLIVDGNESDAPSENATASAGGSEAVFTAVDLEEGEHGVRARCTDGEGNITESGEAEWTVDITACVVTITAPTDGAAINTGDDVDDTDTVIQLDVGYTVDASDCDGVRIRQTDTDEDCTADSGSGAFDDLEDDPHESAQEIRTDLASTPDQRLCLQVRDDAGNVGVDSVDLVVDADAPILDVVTPTSGTLVNVASDGDSSSEGTCEVEFLVNCTDVDVEVTLHDADSGIQLFDNTGAPISANCDEETGLPSGFNGQAAFGDIDTDTDGLAQIASSDDAEDVVSVVARQVVEGVTGQSTPVDITADCNPPELTIEQMASPTNQPAIASGHELCRDDEDDPTVLRPADLNYDADDSSGGMQTEVIVSISDGIDEGEAFTVTLESRRGDGSLAIEPAATATGALPTTTFAATTVAAGDQQFVAVVTDAAGNSAESDGCFIRVTDLDILEIDTPTSGTLYLSETFPSDGCDDGDSDPATMGVQVNLSLETADRDPVSDTDSTTIAVTIGSTACEAIVDPGETTTSVCCAVAIPAGDGTDIPITAIAFDDTVYETSDATMIDIDSSAPEDAVGTVTITQVDRNTLNFEFENVGDADGGNLTDYRVACSAEGATASDDDEWFDLGIQATFAGTPGTPGTTFSEDLTLTEFRPYDALNCYVRGTDEAVRLTPIGTLASFEITLTEQTIDNSTGTIYSNNIGVSMEAIGDVNGDGFDDVAVGTDPGTDMFVFFGSASGLGITAGGMAGQYRKITNDSSGNGYGVQPLAIGDINDDTRPDFAIAQRGRINAGAFGQGKVWAFYGVAGGDFGPDRSIGSGACTGGTDADVCFLNVTAPGAAQQFGFSMAALDFDGDGVDDLAIGNPLPSSINGWVAVIRGKSGLTGALNIDTASLATGPDGWLIDYTSVAGMVSTTGGRMGRGLASCGDLDGDGNDDLLAMGEGASQSAACGTATDSGRVVQTLGQDYSAGSGLQAVAAGASTVVGTGISGFAGNTESWQKGLVCLGDFTGDGRRDFGVVQTRCGAAMLIYPQLSAPVSGAYYANSSMFQISSGSGAASEADEQYGSSMASVYNSGLRAEIGDIDEDGVGDPLVGRAGDTCTAATTCSPGSVDIFYGARTESTMSAAREQQFPIGAAAEQRARAGYIGDINADGFYDWAVGDPNAGTSTTDPASTAGTGRVFVYY